MSIRTTSISLLDKSVEPHHSHCRPIHVAGPTLITGAWLSYDQRFKTHMRKTAVHLLQPDKAAQTPYS
jgi:hypothetical protein